MSKEQDGGPAFPARKERYIAQELTVDYLPGMSLRDWFAGQVVSGVLLMVATKHMAAQMAGDKAASKKLATVFTDSAIAGEAYTIADAMLEARKR